MQIKNSTFEPPRLASPEFVAELIEEIDIQLEALNDLRNNFKKYSLKIGVFEMRLKVIRAELSSVLPFSNRFSEIHTAYAHIIIEIIEFRLNLQTSTCAIKASAISRCLFIYSVMTSFVWQLSQWHN